MSGVVIGAADSIHSLRQLLGADADIRVFSEGEPIKALEAILELQPDLIVLTSTFAASPRGVALLNRIHKDPDLVRSEVRIVLPGEVLAEPVRRSAAATLDEVNVPHISAATDDSPPLDWRGTRRSLRTHVRPGMEIQLDGKPCTVVDLSPLGVQVLSASILKPNQRVRVIVPTGGLAMRFSGTVIWARFELPVPASPPVYRAGIEFVDADAAILSEYLKRNRQDA